MKLFEKVKGLETRRKYFMKYDILLAKVFAAIMFLFWLFSLKADMALSASFAIFVLFLVVNNFKGYLGHNIMGWVVVVLGVEHFLINFILHEILTWIG